jgi:hypothetical protein
MLLDSGNAKDALTAFEATLKKSRTGLVLLPARREPPPGLAMPQGRATTLAKSSSKPAVEQIPVARSPMRGSILQGVDP